MDHINDSPTFPHLAAIENGAETRSTEFKESRPFPDLCWKIVKASIAMANLRDGGRIIIGIEERTSPSVRSGVSDDHGRSYNQDSVLEFVNRFARPPISLTLQNVEYDRRMFIVVEVLPFERGPVMCVRDNGVKGKDQLLPGQIYARSNDRVATTRIVDAELLAEVIEIAAERRARQIIRTAQHIGLQLPGDAESAFQTERADFGDI